MWQSILLVKVELLFRRKRPWRYLTKNKGKNLSHQTINLINAFYEVDEFSKQMLGKKDYVSAFRNTHKQK